MINQVTTRSVGGVTILDVLGSLTMEEGTNAVRENILELLDAGYRNILLNMEDVTHLDGAGVGELIMAYINVANVGGELKLLNLRKRMRDLKRITELYSVFEVFEDELSGILSYSPAGPRLLEPPDRADTYREFTVVGGFPRLVRPPGGSAA